MKIKEFSDRTGLSRDTIRFYEKMGLIPKPKRNKSGYREYDESMVIKTKMVSRAKELGFSLAEIKDLSKLLNNKGLTPKKMAEKLKLKLDDIDLKIQSLNGMKKEIKQALEGLCEYKDFLD